LEESTTPLDSIFILMDNFINDFTVCTKNRRVGDVGEVAGVVRWSRVGERRSRGCGEVG
jgi:hypothetical protein